VFEPVGIVVGGLAEPTGDQGDPDAVEAPGAIGVAHQGVFDAVGFLPGVVAIDDGCDPSEYPGLPGSLVGVKLGR